ncbi:MAG: hypothetical protein JW810_03805 [Sedimentisphaerales bacterium]|nr:hypothetical protein [Sedimentisphaerales bacterium]
MAEVYPSDNELLNLVEETQTGVEFIETGKAPYYVEFRRLLYRLLLATRRANDLRAYDEGGLNLGVKAGWFFQGATIAEYPGSSGAALADNQESIYVYLDRDGNLVTDQYDQFPSPLSNHTRLAIVATSGGDITSITDCRGQQMWFAPGMMAEGAITRLGSAANVDMQTAQKNDLLTVPTGRTVIVTHVVVRDISASLAGGTDYDFGTGVNADGWVQGVDLSGMTNPGTDVRILDTGQAVYSRCAAESVFGVKVNTGATAATTATIDVFGYVR